jgi:hypothetical protein
MWPPTQKIWLVLGVLSSGLYVLSLCYIKCNAQFGWESMWVYLWLVIWSDFVYCCSDSLTSFGFFKINLIFGLFFTKYHLTVKLCLLGGLAWIKRLFVVLLYTWLVCLHFSVLVRFLFQELRCWHAFGCLS